MGLTTWENAPDGKIVKTDVSYLKEMELADMGQLVNGVLELAERMAKRHIPMTMEDWAKQIDTILAAGGNEVLKTAGSVTLQNVELSTVIRNPENPQSPRLPLDKERMRNLAKLRKNE
jgi:hypothetical protein